MVILLNTYIYVHAIIETEDLEIPVQLVQVIYAQITIFYLVQVLKMCIRKILIYLSYIAYYIHFQGLNRYKWGNVSLKIICMYVCI